MSVRLDYSFSEIRTNIANNTSDVQLDIYITTSGESWNGNYQQGTISWGGIYQTDPYQLPRNTQTHVHSEVKTITHNSDGTGTTSFACDIPTTNAGGVQHAEGIIGLTTLPRAASIDSFSCSSRYLDGTMTVKYTSKTSFNYKLRLSIPNVVAIVTKDLGTHSAGQKTTTATFSSSELNTIYSKIGTNTSSCTIGAVIETWSGSTKIGESPELFLTLNMPESIAPTIGTINLTEAVSGLDTKFGAFIQNKSMANVNFTASGATAGGKTSTIKTYQVSVNNQSFTTNSFTTNLLSTSGTNTITVKVTDSRGRTATKTQNFTVLGYTRPTISLFTASRNNTTNTTIDVIFSASITALNNNNDKTFKIKLDNIDQQTYTDAYTKTNQSYSITGTTTTDSYNVTLSVTDYFETVTRTIKVGTAFALMHFTEDGQKISLGKFYDTSAGGVLQIGGKTVFGNASGYNISDDGGLYSGTAANVTTFLTNPTKESAFPIHFTNRLGTTGGVGTPARTNDGLLYGTKEGTTTTPGVATLYIGNNIKSGTDGNKAGLIKIYSQYGGSVYLRPALTQTTAHIVTLPQHAGSIYAATTLYDNTSGTRGNVTLSETAGNFAYIDVYYGYSDIYNNVRVQNPNNKRADAIIQYRSVDKQTIYLNFKNLHFADTTLEVDNQGQWYNVYGTTGIVYDSSADIIRIYKVVGWM